MKALTKKVQVSFLALIMVMALVASSYAMMGAGSMQMPKTQEMYSYGPMQTPVVGTDATSSKPIGVGNVAMGGNILTIQTTTGQFAGPMDVYFMLYVPSVDPLNIYLMRQDGRLQAASVGMVPWKAGVTGVDQVVVDNLPTSMLPAGAYTVGLMAVPSGSNMSTYYLWMTNFMIH